MLLKRWASIQYCLFGSGGSRGVVRKPGTGREGERERELVFYGASTATLCGQFKVIPRTTEGRKGKGRWKISVPAIKLHDYAAEPTSITNPLSSNPGSATAIISKHLTKRSKLLAQQSTKDSSCQSIIPYRQQGKDIIIKKCSHDCGKQTLRNSSERVLRAISSEKF